MELSKCKLDAAGLAGRGTFLEIETGAGDSLMRDEV